MKYLLALFLLTSISVKGQTKPCKVETIGDSVSIYYNTSSLNNIYINRIDTTLCYFLKVPKWVEFPTQAINAEWFKGYAVKPFYSYGPADYLYFDKRPVKEQVLMSIPVTK